MAVDVKKMFGFEFTDEYKKLHPLKKASILKEYSLYIMREFARERKKINLPEYYD